MRLSQYVSCVGGKNCRYFLSHQHYFFTIPIMTKEKDEVTNMENKLAIVAVGCFGLALGIYLRPAPIVEKAEIPLFILEANANLEAQVRDLKQELNNTKISFEAAKSSIVRAETIEAKSKQHQQEMEATASNKDSLSKRGREGMTLIEWRKALTGRGKTALIKLAGKPDKIKKSNTTSDFTSEIWIYNNRVSLEEGTKTNLVVLLDGEEVTRVETSNT